MAKFRKMFLTKNAASPKAQESHCFIQVKNDNGPYVAGNIYVVLLDLGVNRSIVILNMSLLQMDNVVKCKLS